MIGLQVVALSHQGAQRDHNEDTVGIANWRSVGSSDVAAAFILDSSDPVVCAVADGMGGQAAGEVASAFVIDRLCASSSQLGHATALERLLHQINDELYAEMAANPALSTMGSTIAGVTCSVEQILVFNIGDSRIYRESDGYLRQLSVDDTPAAGIDASGQKHTSVLTQSLGGAARRLPVNPHISAESPQAGDRYLLCSDGLTDVVNLDWIEGCFTSDDDVLVVRSLFDAAMHEGARDNVSVVIVRVVEA